MIKVGTGIEDASLSKGTQQPGTTTISANTSKACDRCREHKAKCVWLSASACARCQRTNHACSAPQGGDPISPHSLSSNGSNTESRTTHPRVAGENRTTISEIGTSGEPLQRGRRTVEINSELREEAIIDLMPTPPSEPQLPVVNGSCASTKCYLPPCEEGYRLLREYLHDFNSRMPLFAPQSLQTLFRDCYAGANDGVPLAWVLVYATMAITHRLRAMSLFATPIDTPQGMWYLEMCLTRLPELLMGPPSLKLVQASLCLCFLLQTSNHRQRAELFASTALHMAQSLGYNELPSIPLVDTVLVREQTYVFWIAFVMDVNMSLGHQHSSSQRLADIATPLPPQNVVDWWDLENKSTNTCEWNLNIFSLHGSLAIIEAEASEKLFSVEARKRAPLDSPCVYKGILLKLERWREGNMLSKLDAKEVLQAMYRSDIVHCVMLEGAYFRTRYQLHATRALVGFRVRLDAFTPEALRAVIDQKIEPCYEDAKRFLGLAMLLPQGNLSTTWACFQAIVAAFCSIIATQSIGDAGTTKHKSEDLQLCYEVLVALNYATEGKIELAHEAVINLCQNLYAELTTT